MLKKCEFIGKRSNSFVMQVAKNGFAVVDFGRFVSPARRWQAPDQSRYCRIYWLAHQLLNSSRENLGIERHTRGTTMLDQRQSSNHVFSSTQHLRHDLMIELGRLELAIEAAHGSAEQDGAIGMLQNKQARVNAALEKLPLDC
jgi:hypothetical protein